MQLIEGQRAFEVGRKALFYETHHKMNPILKKQVGKTGIIRAVSGPKCLVEFEGSLPVEYGHKEANRWWMRARYLRHV